MEFAWNDIDGLNGAASEEFGDWGTEIEVTQQMIQDFADLTGDHQWIHVDVERANAGPFGGPIAHGFLTLSLLPKLNPGGLTITGIKNAVNYGSDGFRFLAPVPSGSTIHARSRLVSAVEKPKGTLITTEVAVHVKGNDVPSLLYKMLVLYQG
ncbi:MAG: MaoC family dehydratase [Acidimicrobiales bacterium]|nr:MaoC family dehydratase [Acidimicrobiales bacterium]